MRHYVVLKRRGDRPGATKVLDQMVTLAPDAPSVLELQGEELLERNKPAEAVKVLERAMQAAPGHKEIERKHAKAVLRAAGGFDPLAPPIHDSFVNPKGAALLSVFVPGLGQFVMGDRPKALAIFGVWFISLVGLFLVPNGIEGLVGLVSGGADLPPLVFIPLAGLGFAWLWGITDANSRAKRDEVLRRPIERPTPPVDKPFEL